MKLFKDDEVALVTGGSTGIGQAVARAFAREGLRVAIADVNEKDGYETEKLIMGEGGKAKFFYCDVSKSKDVSNLIDEITGHFGRLDYANNNAGIGEPKRVKLDQVDEVDFDRVIQINLKGVWLCMKYEIPVMLKQGRGAIVNTSSICGLVGSLPLLSSYVASKHGVVGLTKAAALDYAKDGIRINAVCPGSVLTPQLRKVTEKDPSEIEYQASLHPVNRLGTTDEIANAVMWLCSDASSFVHGYPLAVDGGYVAK
jgi:NAD(P)-dependent dehydrogenase (short-subunit alcohol dehydrogenase family)